MRFPAAPCCHLENNRVEEFLLKIIDKLKESTPEQRLKAALLFASFIAYCICFKLIFDFYVPNASGYNNREQLFGDDFLNMWAGSKLLLQGNTLSIFNFELYNQQLKILTNNPDYPPHIFSYPPHLLLFISGFGLFSYFQALVIWSILGLAALILLLHQLKTGLSWSLILITSPIVVANLMMGQNGLFTGVLLFGGLSLSRKHPILAGILFALLTMKPQLGLLIPLILIITRNWKCFISATAGTIILVALSIAVFGADVWNNYLFDTLEFQRKYVLESTVIANYYQFMMPGVYANAYLVGEPIRSFFIILHALICGCVLYKIFHVVNADKDLEQKTILGICLASALISPYFFNYDMTAITVAVMLFMIQSVKLKTHKLDSLLGLCLLLLWTLPLTTLVMRGHFGPGLHVTISQYYMLPSFAMVTCFYLLFFQKTKIPT